MRDNPKTLLFPQRIATADDDSKAYDDGGVHFVSHEQHALAYEPYALFAANGVNNGSASSDSVTDRLDELEQQFQELSSDYGKLQDKYGDLKSSLKNYAKTGTQGCHDGCQWSCTH